MQEFDAAREGAAAGTATDKWFRFSLGANQYRQPFPRSLLWSKRLLDNVRSSKFANKRVLPIPWWSDRAISCSYGCLEG
jgi:hypothetical protein